MNLDLNLSVKRRHKVLNKEERNSVVVALLQHSDINKKLKKGSISVVASQFSVSQHTIRRIWEEAKLQMADGGSVNLTTKLSGNVDRKRVEVDLEKFSKLSLRHRTQLRTIAKKLGISKTTLHRRVKEGVIRCHLNAIKPVLTEENKKARLQFCLSMLELSSVMHNPVFIDMNNFVHVDEKWFYITREVQNYYLLPDEDEPHRTCKSKRFITKVMFLAVVARPRRDPITGIEFSGKIGIFPFVEKVPAKRKSKNRAAGTIETKAIAYVRQEEYKACLIENVLLAILEKWPFTGSSSSSKIYVQQDNAKPHVAIDVNEFKEAAARLGVNAHLVFQPANSPDMNNVLDLGFFRSIESLQQQASLRSIDELIEAVNIAFHELPSENLNRVFYSLQLCMVEVMKSKGCNNYKIPHVNKNKLVKEGNLPTQVSVDPGLIEATYAYLYQQE